jgi:hypothetical protein
MGKTWSKVKSSGQFETKSMFSIFFQTTGVVHIDCANKDVTIDSQYFIENSLKPSIAALKAINLSL